jgi:hypothetical protein
VARLIRFCWTGTFQRFSTIRALAMTWHWPAGESYELTGSGGNHGEFPNPDLDASVARDAAGGNRCR